MVAKQLSTPQKLNPEIFHENLFRLSFDNTSTIPKKMMLFKILN